MTKRVNDRDTRANINKIFALYDDERTGYISIKNLRRVAEEIGENVSEQELQELITRADVDCDGLVSEEEFYVIVTRKIKDWLAWSIYSIIQKTYNNTITTIHWRPPTSTDIHWHPLPSTYIHRHPIPSHHISHALSYLKYLYPFALKY